MQKEGIKKHIVQFAIWLSVWTLYLMVSSYSKGDIENTYWVLGWFLYPIAHIITALFGRAKFVRDLGYFPYYVTTSIVVCLLYWPIWLFSMHILKAVLRA